MAKNGEKSDWKEFLWNPRTREFLGRTASSWGKCCPATAMQQTGSPGSVTGLCHSGFPPPKGSLRCWKREMSVCNHDMNFDPA